MVIGGRGEREAEREGRRRGEGQEQAKKDPFSHSEVKLTLLVSSWTVPSFGRFDDFSESAYNHMHVHVQDDHTQEVGNPWAPYICPTNINTIFTCMLWM